MAYRMEIYADGGCRDNGQPESRGAAAAVFKPERGQQKILTQVLPRWPRPTNQRAEMWAIILALKHALEMRDSLISNPWLDLKIYSDSTYAVRCMTEWIDGWSRNGWTNSAGNGVANLDLVQEASCLDDRLHQVGTVEYIWIPRARNLEADSYCNQALNGAY